MSYFSADKKPLIELYQRETTELLKEYNDCLMIFSRDMTLTQENIDAIFRAVHTLKGSSAMIGLDELSVCAHRCEDLLHIFRSNVSLAKEHGWLLSLLYSFGEYAENEVAAVSAPDFEPSTNKKQLALIDSKLALFPETDGCETDASPMPEKAQEADSQPAGDIKLTVHFSEECRMENVRAFQLIKLLRPVCSAISSVPSQLQQKNAAALIRRNGLLLSVRSDEPDTVEDILRSSLYVSKVSRGERSEDKLKSKPAGGASSDRATKYGMVAWDKLLAMQNIVGELITAQTVLNATLADSPAYKDAEGELVQNKKLLSQLEQMVNEVSLTPVSSVASQYYRLVNEISAKQGKQVRFELIGEELEIDRRLLDAMSAPLLHIIRNAVDHGIEVPQVRSERGKPQMGTLRLSVENVGGNVRFSVSDDGNGMDPKEILKKATERNLLTKPAEEYGKQEILNFIFTPGFSTTKQANEYSGRGVGMDVVQKAADSLHGIVRVDSEFTVGSTISIEVPASMSSFECICFDVGEHICMFPMRNIQKTIAYRDMKDCIRTIGERLWLECDDTLLPVVDLYGLFGVEKSKELRLIVISSSDMSAVLLTGIIRGEQTIVEKPLPTMLNKTFYEKFGIGGCAVIGSGKLSMVLNPEMLLKICPKEENLPHE